MKKLQHYDGVALRNSNLIVTFKNEEGVYIYDFGVHYCLRFEIKPFNYLLSRFLGICTGPKREFFVNVCKDILSERYKLFYCNDDNQYRFVKFSFLLIFVNILVYFLFLLWCSFFPNAYFINEHREPSLLATEDEKFKHQSRNLPSIHESSNNGIKCRIEALEINSKRLRVLGNIIGKAIFDGFFVNFHLCKPLVKQVCKSNKYFILLSVWRWRHSSLSSL